MIDQGCDEKIGRVAGMIAKAENVVVFTGAGVSTESGIPDFRSPGGFWTKFDPEDFTIDKYLASPETRRKQWRFLLSGDLFKDARPNAAHEAIADLERLARLNCVITQNIDNLHQAAGSQVVHEFHGATRELVCLGCAGRLPAFEMDWSELPPLCPRCGGLLKPDFVFFGEAIPERAGTLSFAAAETADVMLVVGTSGEVMPACSLPRVAKERGAKIIEVNLGPSAYTARVSDIFLDGPAGEILPSLAGAAVAALRQEEIR